MNSGICCSTALTAGGSWLRLRISFTPTGLASCTPVFFIRAEWSLDGFDLNEETFQEQFGAIARWGLAWSVQRPCVAIFVSRYQHCLLDLLHLYEIGD